jgi:TPR repeat protein
MARGKRPRAARPAALGGSFRKGLLARKRAACDSLAHLYHDGRGVPKDDVRMAKYRKLACGLADPTMREFLCRPDRPQD